MQNTWFFSTIILFFARITNPRYRDLDEAVWINFRHRTTDYRVGVIQSVEGGYILAHPNHSVYENEHFEVLPSDYSDMSYEHIASIGMDEETLKHWEEIRGTIQIIDGEILRFILAKKVPLEKLSNTNLPVVVMIRITSGLVLKKPRKFGLKKIEYLHQHFFSRSVFLKSKHLVTSPLNLFIHTSNQKTTLIRVVNILKLDRFYFFNLTFC